MTTSLFGTLPSFVDVANFLQAGTGAILRTLLSKLRESKSVTDFGVTGDGVTDDTTAFQTALDAIRVAGGGILYVPPGTYIINKALRIGAKTQLRGAGRASILKAKQSGGYVGVNGGSYATQTCQLLQNYNFSASSLTDDNIVIEHLTIDWGTVTIAGGGAHSISLRQVDEVIITNVYGINGENVTALLACRNTLVFKCRGEGQSNCYFDHWDGAESAKVIACVGRTSVNISQGIQFTGTSSFAGARSSSKAVVAYNEIYNVRGASGSSSAIIANANQAASSAISLKSFGNYIEDCDLGLVFQGATGQHLSRGDTFKNVTKLPIFFNSDASGTPSNCRVIDPHLIDCNHTAPNVALISITGTNNTVQGVRITNSGAAPYTLIGWLTAASVTCSIGIERAPSGSGGSRVQNDSTTGKVFDYIRNSWSPTFSADANAFTLIAATNAKYIQMPGVVHFSITISLTTKGPATGAVRFTLPVPAAASSFAASGSNDTTGTVLRCLYTNASQVVRCTKYDGTDPLADGTFYTITGSYEPA